MPPLPRLSVVSVSTVSTRVRLTGGPTLLDRDGRNLPVRSVHVACSVHLRSPTTGVGIEVRGKKGRGLGLAGADDEPAKQDVTSRLVTSADGKSHEQKTWRRNRWKVRRQRYMYDMLGLIKKGKVGRGVDYTCFCVIPGRSLH